MTITPCPCGCTEAFGPALIVFEDEDGSETEVRYVNCKRCGAMLVLGRDVEATT